MCQTKQRKGSAVKEETSLVRWAKWGPKPAEKRYLLAGALRNQHCCLSLSSRPKATLPSHRQPDGPPSDALSRSQLDLPADSGTTPPALSRATAAAFAPSLACRLH